jgi:cytochrome b involved in lipid metabolism
MNKKIIITILVIIIIAIASIFLLGNRGPLTKTDNIPARNDTVINSYSISDIALHDKATDCWMAIDGKVIDPTVFIAAGLHPNDNIVDGCGKDATAMFTQVDKHDGGKAKTALKQYEIGVLK